MRGEVQQYLTNADVVLAVGTELSEVDSFVETLEINGKIIRIDLDSKKMNDIYPAEVAIIGGGDYLARPLQNSLVRSNARRQCRRGCRDTLRDSPQSRRERATPLQDAGRAAQTHYRPETVVMGDICQLVYSGAFAFDVPRPRQWNYPSGLLHLGSGLPDAIGAKLALPDTPVVTIAGDGGFMFTCRSWLRRLN